MGTQRIQKRPVVTVSCTTYNHELFIKDAIDGFLAQKTTFPVEIIIHDDASTDRTAETIREYVRKYPEQIRPIYQTENQYSLRRKITATVILPACRGRYVALCEGDDYWTDPYKLQKQVDFLEANSDFALCFHKVKVLKGKKLIDDYITSVPGEITTIEDLAVTNYIHTPSVVFRAGLIKEFPAWYFESPIGDYPLHLLNAQYGKIKYMDDVMGIYRVHGGGVYSHRKKDDTDYLKRWIKAQELMVDYFKGNVRAILLKKLSVSCLELSEIYQSKGEDELAKELFRQSASHDVDLVYRKYSKYKSVWDRLKRIRDVVLFRSV